jgi:outer membrane immunogenic protein
MPHHRPRVVTAAPFAFALLSAAGAAAAQENPTPWSGFYVGAALGGAWNNSSLHAQVAPGPGPVTISPTDAATINANVENRSRSGSGGFTGGIEGGYNYESGPWLFGLETDFGAFRISDSATRTVQSRLLISPPRSFTVGAEVKTNWLWTLRPRVGYVSGPWLIYGTAGLAMSSIKATANYTDTRIAPTVFTSATRSKTATGWTAGLGGAYALNPEWSVKGEWLYVKLGSVSGSATTPDGFATVSGDATASGNLFRVGLDYRF